MSNQKKYSAELKLKAVKEFLSGKKSADAIAKELNLSSGRIISKWMLIYKDFGEAGFVSKRGTSTKSKGRPKKHFNSLEEENEYLRAKVDFLEMVMKLDVKKK